MHKFTNGLFNSIQFNIACRCISTSYVELNLCTLLLFKNVIKQTNINQTQGNKTTHHDYWDNIFCEHVLSLVNNKC